jgi:hypothetical protein
VARYGNGGRVYSDEEESELKGFNVFARKAIRCSHAGDDALVISCNIEHCRTNAFATLRTKVFESHNAAGIALIAERTMWPGVAMAVKLQRRRDARKQTKLSAELAFACCGAAASSA